MAFSVSVGETLDLTGAKYGTSAKGDWLLVKVKDEKSYDTIDVFVENASEARDWDTGKIKTIKSVRRTKRQINGKWIQFVTTDVTMTKGAPKSLHHPGDEFMTPPDDLDGLPFA